MGKPGGLGLFMGRRKSFGNVMDGVELSMAPEAPPPATDSGGFRVLTQTEVQRVKQEKDLKKAEKSSKFPRFSGFGGAGNKARKHSFEEDSPSSKRDSKSSSGTQFSSSRPYHNGQGGSTSTLPSSADYDPNESIFAGLPPRPPIQQHGSSPGSLSMSGIRKQLPSLPPQTKSAGAHHLYDEPTSPNQGYGRQRALTTSSYASTAIPPKLDADLNFGGGFDDMFTGLDRTASPDFTRESGGRSLLGKKRAFQSEPIKIDTKLEIEPSLQSWDSRGSDDNLMSPGSDKNYSPPPPPVPAHTYSSKYAPVASESPVLNGEDFEDRDARLVQQSFMAQKPVHQNMAKQDPNLNPNPNPNPISSATSQQTPVSSKSTANHTTPKATLQATPSHVTNDDDDLFTPSKPKTVPAPKYATPVIKEDTSAAPRDLRRMTMAEFRAHQEKQMPESPDSSEEEDDYEDEEDLIERRQKEEQARRHAQQQQIARIHLQRATTTPADSSERDQSMGFPSEVSMQADQWDDEDVPLGVLAAHGFPSSTRQPSQPPNAAPSYFRTTPSALPDRPSSAGPMGNRASTYRPPFARGLPDDPYSSVVGGGLVRPTNRESMGFNRGPSSVYGGEPMLPYHEPNSAPSLVERIHMKELSKPQYTGGASSKNALQGGPFTGALGGHMNGMGQSANPHRMSQMPMQGMNGGPMMGMMGGQMPMMGMNPMGFPMSQNDQLVQMQQMFMAQQMQMQQMQQMYSQQQNPRMSMVPPNLGFQNPNFGNGSMMNFPEGTQNQQRPTSMMSQQRPYSTPSQFGAPPPQQGGFQMGGLTPPTNNGYTASIAPSERSNIGLSARYRPIATGNQDTASNVSSSKTLQASGGAAASNMKVKGILKNKSPQTTVREDDEDWGKMAARKSKFFGKSKTETGSGLQDLARAVDSF